MIGLGLTLAHRARSRVSRLARFGVLVLVCFGLVFACGGKQLPPRGGLMLTIVADERPDVLFDADKFKVEVRTGDTLRFANEFAFADTAPPNNTVSIVSNGDPGFTVKIAVMAWKSDPNEPAKILKPLDRRDAIVTQVPAERVVSLIVRLSGRCKDQVELTDDGITSKCGATKTCNPDDGTCSLDTEIDARTLPTWDPAAPRPGIDGSNPTAPDAGGPVIPTPEPGPCSPPPGFNDCTNRCGLIRNPCTGVITQCGGCQGPEVGAGPNAIVCDLASNTCIKPKLTCLDLGAECGRVRNSCGASIDCPAGSPSVECSAGNPGAGLSPQTCDPNTNKCVTATSATCQDRGYECGTVWLGAGPKTLLTNCGDCSSIAGRPRCSPILNVCEPACAPPTSPAQKLAICNTAKTARGVECGVISDGCGGTIDCTKEAGFECPNGATCGLDGIANRCDESPVECKAAGRNCGTIKSACSGAAISCGQCTGTDVCNANGVCGSPCVPKTCADLGSPACVSSSAPKPDGCGGFVTDCPVCPGGHAACRPGVATAVGGTCCIPQFTCQNGKRPPGVAANACGSQLFDNGCGVKLNCGCSSGSCINGTCCSTSECPADGNAGDSCGRVDLACGAACTKGCKNDSQGNSNTCRGGVCCDPEPDSPSEWQAKNPGRCQFNIPDGCGGVVDAPCATGTCIDVATAPGNPVTKPGNGSPSALGYCCTIANAACGAHTCQLAASACVIGTMVSCGAADCSNGPDGTKDEVCFDPPGTDPPACCDPSACPASSPAGGSCTSGATFDRGCGLACTRGCIPDAQSQPNVCVSGTCCNPEPDNEDEWQTQNPGGCAFNISNGCDGRLDARCNAGELCQKSGAQLVKNGSLFASGNCCAFAASCGSSAKAPGETCRVANVCLAGQKVTCPCAGDTTCYQDKCCAPNTCPTDSAMNGPCGPVDLGCGVSCTRGCSAGTCREGSCVP